MSPLTQAMKLNYRSACDEKLKVLELVNERTSSMPTQPYNGAPIGNAIWGIKWPSGHMPDDLT